MIRSLMLNGVASAATVTSMSSRTMSTVHTANIVEVHDVPFSIIIRPLPSTLDEQKVVSLITTLKDPSSKHLVPPIDLLWVVGSEGGNYYFSFGGCHRYEAYRRLNVSTVPCKIVKSTVQDLHVYMGNSVANLK